MPDPSDQHVIDRSRASGGRVAALGDELLRIHDTLRAELRRLQDGVRDPGRPLAVRCLAFCAALTGHHTGEDAGAFPALVDRFPELAPLLAGMAEDHHLISLIVARIEEVAAAGDPGSPASSPASRPSWSRTSRSRSAASGTRSTPSTARPASCSALRRTARCSR